MGRYILRRLLHLVPVMFVVTALVFSITLLLPGDPTLAILGDQANQQDRAILREKLGLDRPIPLQYVTWLSHVATGDFGRSLRTQEKVADMLSTRVPVTLELTATSIALAVLIGVPLGTLAAIRRNRWPDLVLSFVSMGGVALPFFWAGILLIMFFSLHLGWLPPSGYVAPWKDPGQNLLLMIMPTITIGTAMSAMVMRQTRTAMIQVMSQDYVRLARAKGASEPRVVVLHALRNALIPVVTVVGLETGALVGGAVVTETVFSLPGLGRMVVEGIFERDFAAVQAAVLVIVVGVLLVNLAADLCYALLDRRIKI